MVPMHANFGGFNPAQYQQNPDQSLSRIGDRFANLAADVPRLWREGEKWQGEREARSAGENLKAHTYNQMATLSRELGGGEDVLRIRPPEKGETVENYALYAGSVIEGLLQKDPTKYDVIMAAALKVGQGGNKSLPVAKADSLLMGAGNGQQAAGGINDMATAAMPSLQGQPPQEANRFELPFDPYDPHVSMREQAKLNLPELEKSIYGQPAAAQPESAIVQTPMSGAPPINTQAAAQVSQFAGNQAAAREATRLRGLAGEIETDIKTLRGRLASLEGGGSGSSPQADRIRTRLDDKIKTLIMLEDKIANAERPEKENPLLPYKIKNMEADTEKKKRPSTSKSGSGGSAERLEFNTALSHYDRRNDDVAAAKNAAAARLNQLNAAKENKIDSASIKKIEAALETDQKAYRDALDAYATSFKFLRTKDKDFSYGEANQTELHKNLNLESIIVANNMVDNLRVMPMGNGGKFTVTQQNYIKGSAGIVAKKYGLSEEETKDFIRLITKREHDIANQRRR